MKNVMTYSSFDLHQNSRTDIESVKVLMDAMGINNFSGVNVPEQEDILYVLEGHHPEGLLTREIANKCEMTIYKVRHLLLPLEQHGQVARVKVGKHHKWYFHNENSSLKSVI